MAFLDRFRPQPPVSIVEAKASSGIGAFWMSTEPSVSLITRSPQKLMRQAQDVYASNRNIRKAERVIAQRFSTVEWHLEDGEDERLPDEDPIVQLLEKPYTPGPKDPLNSTPRTRSGLWQITCRHMGVCGNAFWYLDQADALAGIPLQCLYINPSRMTPATDNRGNLIGWVLDADARGGGVPLERERVLHFVLEPPDSGFLATGLVETAMSMVSLGGIVDNHATGVFASGGRLAGVFSPKTDAIPQDQFDQLKRDLRIIADSPDAAKRALVLQGPIDFTRTSGTLSELDLVAVANMTRDEVTELWGVPRSQYGGAGEGGLNSGESKGHDYEILWQNAVGPRLRSFRETLQFGFLDRFEALGRTVELEIEEPTFDDDEPKFALAEKALNQPLTVDERRGLMGLDPLDPEVYGDFGTRIYQPLNLTETWAPVMAPPPSAPTPPQLTAGDGEDMAMDTAKASPLARVSPKWTPKMQAAVSKVLAEQRTEVAQRVRAQAAHLAKKPTDTTVWWNQSKWDKRLNDALAPFAESIGNDVETKVKQKLGKADLPSGVLKRLLANIAKRVVGINETTRDSIALLISNNIGKGGAELGDLIEQHTAFDENRAEMVARTETAVLQNGAAIASYDEFGVTHVEVIDGDEDDECASANGSTWTLDEADSNPLAHPNCVRDFVPVLS